MAHHRSHTAAIAVLTFLAGIIITIGVLIPLLRHRQAPSHNVPTSQVTQPQSALEVFWGPLVHEPEGPFVVFRNLTFVGEAATGMRRFDPSRDNPHQAIQGFTGVGEVMGILELAQLFDKFGSRLRVKREDLFTIDDARHSDLIVVGSPGTALSIREIRGHRNSPFEDRTSVLVVSDGRSLIITRDREQEIFILELPRWIRSLMIMRSWL